MQFGWSSPPLSPQCDTCQTSFLLVKHTSSYPFLNPFWFRIQNPNSISDHFKIICCSENLSQISNAFFYLKYVLVEMVWEWFTSTFDMVHWNGFQRVFLEGSPISFKRIFLSNSIFFGHSNSLSPWMLKPWKNVLRRSDGIDRHCKCPKPKLAQKAQLVRTARGGPLSQFFTTILSACAMLRTSCGLKFFGHSIYIWCFSVLLLTFTTVTAKTCHVYTYSVHSFDTLSGVIRNVIVLQINVCNYWWSQNVVLRQAKCDQWDCIVHIFPCTGVRSRDLLSNRQALYQLSYASFVV